MTTGHREEQRLVGEAARAALARHDHVAAVRTALDGEPLPDLWPVATQAGWPGLLMAEAQGGAGLGLMEAMLVCVELGRALAPIPLLGHLPATLVVGAADGTPAGLTARLAGGELRAVFVPARPPLPGETTWTAEPDSGLRRLPAPRVDEHDRVTGTVGWVPDAPGADVLVVVATDTHHRPVAMVVSADDAVLEPLASYDTGRPIGHVLLRAAPGRRLHVAPAGLEAAWFTAQGLLGAESVGATERLLEMAVAYARTRQAFGRAIGSYQAVKHRLTEILRRLQNAQALLWAAGAADQRGAGEPGVAAAALRYVAGDALDFAARTAIAVHGGIGATWEHDAPLYFRRAQLSRRLLGGNAGAADHVGATLLRAAGRPATA